MSLLRAATQPSSSALSHPFLVAFGPSPHRRRDELPPSPEPRLQVLAGIPSVCARNACLPDQAFNFAHRNIELTCSFVPVAPQSAASKLLCFPIRGLRIGGQNVSARDQLEAALRVYLLFLSPALLFFFLVSWPRTRPLCVFWPPLFRFLSQSILPSSLTVTCARWGGIGRSHSGGPRPSHQTLGGMRWLLFTGPGPRPPLPIQLGGHAWPSNRYRFVID